MDKFLMDLLARRSDEQKFKDLALRGRAAATKQRDEAKRTNFTSDEKRLWDDATRDLKEANAMLKGLDERIEHTRSEIERSGAGNPLVARIKGGGAARASSTVAPMGFTEQQLRALHGAAVSQTGMRVESRGFNSVDSMLPPTLWQGILGPRHEGRILNRLVSVPMEAPIVEWISHGATTGTAGVTAEGALKNEAIFAPIRNNSAAIKIAINAGVSWEITQDWTNYVEFVQSELMNLCIDKENLEFLSGPGTAGEMTGWLNTSGILTHVVGSESPLDTLEQSITQLRVGPALATADLIILHPSTWSAVRRTKTTQGQYLTQPDPTVGEANTAWGVDVLTTTQIAAGAGIVMDTRLMGRVHVREPLSLRLGYANDDYTRNIVRHIVEERLVLATERASAVLSITGLPTS